MFLLGAIIFLGGFITGLIMSWLLNAPTLANYGLMIGVLGLGGSLLAVLSCYLMEHLGITPSFLKRAISDFKEEEEQSESNK